MNKGLQRTFEKLSKTEKRYINISFDTVKQKNMFDAYQVLSGESANQQAISNVIQSRLLDHILLHLSSYHASKSPNTKIKEDLSKSKVLRMKGDYKLSDKYLMKARQQAIDQGQLNLLLQIIEMQILSFKREGLALHESRELLEQLHEDEAKVLKELELLSQIRYHTLDFLLISRNKVGPLSAEINEEYAQIIEKYDALIGHQANAQLRIYLSNLKGMYAFNNGDFEVSKAQFHITSEIIEATYLGQQLYAQEYFFALNNQLITIVLTQQLDNYTVLLKKIKSYFQNHAEFERELFATTLMYEIGLYTEIGKFDEVVALENTIVDGLKRLNINNVNRHIFLFNLAYAMFATGNTSKANRYAIDLISDTPTKRVKSNSNIYFYANLLTLIIRLERKEYDYLPYAIKSTLVQMKKIRELNAFDKKVIKYIKQVTQTPEKNLELVNQLQKMELITTSDESKFAHQFFDFKKWMMTRATGKRMIDLNH